MKKYFLIIMIILGFYFFNSCTKPENKICACGVKNPAKNLPWLTKLIEKAENDYFGVIWLENYNDQDVFVTNMQLPGPFVDKVINCEGNYMFTTIDDIDTYVYFANHLTKEIVIYASPGYPLN
jgi:hypothetical protein